MNSQADASVTKYEILREDDGYPQWFAELNYEPESLYVYGKRQSFSRGISVIGSREATPYGEKAAYTIARWAADYGIPVYSGCARGCDQAAHRGALDAGGVTAAIMGCGADVVYPSSAHQLLERIKLSGGVVSPFPWKTSPRQYTFVMRNRLIVALSYFVIVVEGTIDSGTNSAISHAQELGIDAYGVPGSIFSRQSEAPNKLISDCGGIISCQEDIKCALERLGVQCSSTLPSSCVQGVELSSTQQVIVKKLQNRALTFEEIQDEMSSLCKIDISVLGVMELHGIIYKYLDGKYYVA